jgi:hypothetical protein
VAGGDILPPRRAGSLTGPLTRMLAADPGDRPQMPEVRDELAMLAAGRDGDTTTVLLGRTDLGSAGPGAHPTAVFPTAEATPAPPPPPPAMSSPPTRTDAAGVPGEPARPPARPAREPGRRRGRALWVLAGLVAVVLAGLIAFWVIALDPDDSADAQGTASATSESPEPTQDGAEQTTAENTEPPESTEPTEQGTTTDGTAEAEPLSAAAITDFVVGYHEQVLTDPRSAYARTGPTLRNAISEGNYVAYWDQFSDVVVSDIQASDGQPTATATMELRYPDGTSETATHTLTFLVQDGELLLDSDVQS